MAIIGDRYVGTYEGHTIELVRNNWNKPLKLLIDGREAASESCMLPGRITLAGTLEHLGAPRAAIARSVSRRLLWTVDTVEVDGKELVLTSDQDEIATGRGGLAAG
jgi:hypothetical protein